MTETWKIEVRQRKDLKVKVSYPAPTRRLANKMLASAENVWHKDQYIVTLVPPGWRWDARTRRAVVA